MNPSSSREAKIGARIRNRSLRTKQWWKIRKIFSNFPETESESESDRCAQSSGKKFKKFLEFSRENRRESARKEEKPDDGGWKENPSRWFWFLIWCYLYGEKNWLVFFLFLGAGGEWSVTVVTWEGRKLTPKTMGHVAAPQVLGKGKKYERYSENVKWRTWLMSCYEWLCILVLDNGKRRNWVFLFIYFRGSREIMDGACWFWLGDLKREKRRRK